MDGNTTLDIDDPRLDDLLRPRDTWLDRLDGRADRGEGAGLIRFGDREEGGLGGRVRS